MENPLDFDAHIQWLSICLQRICLLNTQNEKPLLSLTLNNNNSKCPIYEKEKKFPEKLSIDDIKTGLPYVFIVHIIYGFIYHNLCFGLGSYGKPSYIYIQLVV